MQKSFIQESRLGATLVLVAGALSPAVIGQCLTFDEYNACREYPDPFGGTFNCSTTIGDTCAAVEVQNDDCGDAVGATTGLSAEMALPQATCTWQEKLCTTMVGVCANGNTSTSVRNCEKATGASCPAPPLPPPGGPPEMIPPEE
jgi:hypothetical protein